MSLYHLRLTHIYFSYTRFRWIIAGSNDTKDHKSTVSGCRSKEFAISDVYIGNHCPGNGCSGGRGSCKFNDTSPHLPYCKCDKGFTGLACEKIVKPNVLVSSKFKSVFEIYDNIIWETVVYIFKIFLKIRSLIIYYYECNIIITQLNINYVATEIYQRQLKYFE